MSVCIENGNLCIKTDTNVYHNEIHISHKISVD